MALLGRETSHGSVLALPLNLRHVLPLLKLHLPMTEGILVTHSTSEELIQHSLIRLQLERWLTLKFNGSEGAVHVEKLVTGWGRGQRRQGRFV